MIQLNHMDNGIIRSISNKTNPINMAKWGTNLDIGSEQGKLESPAILHSTGDRTGEDQPHQACLSPHRYHVFLS